MAPTLVLLFTVMVHWFGLPATGVQLFDHPSKFDPLPWAAVSVTTVPTVKVPVHPAGGVDCDVVGDVGGPV